MKELPDRDPHPLWGAAYKVALWRYRFLAEAVPQDFRQAVSLAVLAPDCKPGNIRNAVDREMYALARAQGFVRPSRGLPRGKCGKWTRVEDELIRRIS